MRRTLFFLACWVGALACVAAESEAPEAIVVIVADQHSAYERTAQFVGKIDALKHEHPGVPLAVLIDGDAFEFGNVVARRTGGAIDFAMFAALARRAPTIVNLGNHEPEFHDVTETVSRLEAAGVRVVSGNLRNRATGRPYAPASHRLQLGRHEAVVVGVTTDRLSTYRLAIRPQLDLTDPVAWARENFPVLFKDTALPIVLSHAGLRADRAMVSLVPPGALFAGAHDHLRFVHREGATVYVHSGSWMEGVSVARLRRDGGRWTWDVAYVPLQPDGPVDDALAGLVRDTLATQLTAEETAVVGHSPRAFPPSEAARFAVEAARVAAEADVAVIGATTFGAGLPAGAVTRFAFDACVRFDGALFVAEVDGAWLRQLFARANQGPDTPFGQRAGENLVASAPREIVDGRVYRLVTTDWVAKNARTYLGENPPALAEGRGLTLKAAVLAGLRH